MREILFRGKRKNGNEWVYGNYCGAEYLSSSGIEHLIIEIPRNGCSAQIDPETIGQYTGLTDKNGSKKIFEGDIVKTKAYGKDNGKGQNSPGYDTFAVVWFDYGFYIENKNRMYKIISADRGFEVIGNIHDNPELLKGGENG